jgi:DUF971 family protein
VLASAIPAPACAGACPCAECRGEAGVRGRLDLAPELEAKELVVTDVGLIGHATGIYTFRYLRMLDPKGAASGSGPPG